MNKNVYIAVLTLALLFSSITSAFAHVVVTPAEVGVAKYTNFTVGVPNEKDIPTTAVRLIIPEGVTSVRPLMKPGWNIEIKKETSADDARVTEIIWSGGSVPANHKDEFLISAKTPSSPTNLQWKAYQTYEDNTVVAWDKAPVEAGHESEEENTGPYSQTKVVDDLSDSKTDPIKEHLPYAAIVISLIALAVAVLRKK